MTREEAKAIIEKLVNRFAEQRNGYHAADYNETKTRRDFIDPLFTAFGWDMDNSQDVAEPYREVIHEDKVKIQGKTKAPDYGFRLQGAKERLFFVEAKKPSVSLKTNKESAFQVRRYGWNSGVSVSILTNFEEFIIYDCSKKPALTESPAVGRLKYFTYDQLLKEFDFIYDIFSHEAVVKGRFDNYVKSDTAKKGTQTPDKEFVVSLDKWRRFIAIDIAKSNLKLNEDEINFAVQLIIDRLIFLRFCEDRGVETYGQLKTAVSKGDSYKNLCAVFKTADDKYNSGLFDFKKDQITQNLKVTNKIIKGIIEDLYYPQSEYDFKALPVEVLGNAYEQFLGKVIRINKAHHAVIEEKPEVRKAGGVYYTPQYIVDYIVENTLGKLIKGKTPKEIEKIKIVDPACGSGSFLLGAFQYLLNYHSAYYHGNGFTNKKTKDNPLTPNGTLSTAEKKKILLNNIYGVDIDNNAVEVSKLSLLLKCMEGETSASIEQQITMFHERVLPDLDNNIKDGNSLIDTDFYDNEFDLGFEKKINPFSWKKEFTEVFKQGGFDIVIGNPPYVSVKEIDIVSQKYFSAYYSLSKGQIDLYSLFIEKGLQLINKNSVFSFIIPDSIIDRSNFTPLRKLILDNSELYQLTTMNNVFEQANVGSLIFFCSKSKITDSIKLVKSKDLASFKSNENILFETSKEIINKNENYNFSFINAVHQKLIDKIFKGKKRLIDFSLFGRGEEISKKADFISKTKKNNVPFITGDDIQRYSCIQPRLYIPKNEIKKSIEKLYCKKIVVRQVGSFISATYDDIGCVTPQSVYSLNPINKNNTLFILGLLNSSLFNFIYKSKYKSKEIFPRILLENLKDLPIVEASNNKEISKNVDSLLKLQEEIKNEKTQSKIEQIKRHVEHTEEKIDQLVYELYELTPEEIKIVEGGDDE
ncbi:MAG: Eco57I restriction-modification methylase domain-containing protein [Bacteroidia bacterium]